MRGMHINRDRCATAVHSTVSGRGAPPRPRFSTYPAGSLVVERHGSHAGPSRGSSCRKEIT